MPSYDPEIVRRYANRLYRQARSIIFWYTLIGLGAGALTGLYPPVARYSRLFAILGGVWGFAVGEARAFRCKLRAQEALCQLQIELNTRHNKPEPTAASAGGVESTLQTGS